VRASPDDRRELRKTDGLELAQELHQVRIVSPLLFSATPATGIARSQSLRFHCQVCFRIEQIYSCRFKVLCAVGVYVELLR
jgi:hypothetical protein